MLKPQSPMWLCLEIAPSRRWWRLNEVIGWGPDPTGLEATPKDPSLPVNSEDRPCEDIAEAHPQAKGVLDLELGLQNCENVRVYCLSHPGCSILVWSPSRPIHLRRRRRRRKKEKEEGRDDRKREYFPNSTPYNALHSNYSAEAKIK